MARRTKRKYRKGRKIRHNKQRSIGHVNAQVAARRVPDWSTTLSCAGGALACFHPYAGALSMLIVWMVAFWECSNPRS